MSEPKGTEKLKSELKQEAIDKVPPAKADPKTLTKILRAAKENE